jgi:signal peptidase I
MSYITDTVEPEDSQPPLPDEEGQPSSPGQTLFGLLWDFLETVFLTLVIFFLIQFIIRNFKVDGSSMEPNLHNGQFLIVDKVSYRFSEPRRGDIIVFVPPTNPYQDYIKRIIALPGETVEVKKGEVYVNNQLLVEPYTPHKGSYTMAKRVVGQNEVFVLGDNRDNSNDSHNWGALQKDRIVGRAWVSYWPPDLWGVIPHDAPVINGTLSDLINHNGNP